MPSTLKIPEREHLIPASVAYHRDERQEADTPYKGQFNLWGTYAGYSPELFNSTLGVIRNACVILNNQVIANCTSTVTTTCVLANDNWRLFTNVPPAFWEPNYTMGRYPLAVICAELKYENIVQSAIERVQRFSRQNLIAEALDSIFDTMDALLDQSDFDSIDEILKKVPVENLNKAIVVALLRSTSQASALLGNWQELKARAHRHLTSIGESAETILGGL